MEDIKAIDVMNYPFTKELVEKWWLGSHEMRLMKDTMFKGRIPFMMCTPEEYVAEMDKAGYDKVFITMPKMYSYHRSELLIDFTLEEIHGIIKDYPDRLIGMVSYNPLKIMESLRTIDRAVKEFGFKGVYAHTLGQNVPANDKRMYPCYAKCAELGIPFSMQLGHSLEVLPSDPGRPIYMDQAALDFSELTFIGSHTGWPWCEELIALAWKHPNVYLDISAHLPKYLDQSIINFMNSRGQKKCLYGTNGMNLAVYRQQFLDLPIKDETKKAVLRDNAIKLFNLE
ncbi:MAG: amidohydrolase family protein [Thermodesulfobacteriota bacterium]|nr:amidohydrolase family protein [Thermodesulfobacteriota bacterium]